MKLYHSKLASHNLLSPRVNLHNIPFSEILSSLGHQRCISVKNSPYQSQQSIENLRSILRCASRYHSPKFESKKKTKIKKIPSKKIILDPKIHRKKKSCKLIKTKSIDKLKDLDKKNCKYAPKVFHNQIFRDIYDSTGNHDRIFESSNQSKDYSQCDDLIISGKLLIPSNIKKTRRKEKKCKVRPPENSYLEETNAPTDIHQDIFKKLNDFALTQGRNSDESI